MVLVVKNLPANVGDVRDAGLIPGSGRSLGEENGNPLQCSCLESLMDRGARQAAVHRVAKSWTRLKRLGPHVCKPKGPRSPVLMLPPAHGGRAWFLHTWEKEPPSLGQRRDMEGILVGMNK